jgi:predicted RND superfamily exporter protein
VLEKLVGAIESATGVDHAFSLLEPLRLASSLMRGGSPGTFGLPADDFTLELAYKMVSSDQETMERLASERAQVYRILLPLNLLGGNEFNGVVDQLERVEAEFPGVAVEPVGVVYRLMSVQATILHEQLLSLGFAALGIAVLVGSFFGSLRFMVLTLIVNTSPILVTGSAMALFDIPLDLITAMVASVALGISVDDTIHLLWEYRRSNGAHADRITVVLRRVGQPVIVTTLILVAGFCILGSARFPPISRFGWLAAATLGLSLLFQLLALPSLLAASPTNAEKKGTEDCAQEQPVPAHALPSSGWLEEKHEPDERSAHCAAEESHSRLPSR